MAQITITIPDNKINQYKTWFLAYNPVPVPTDGSPQMSDMAWIKLCLKNYLLNQCKSGENKLATEAHAASGVSDNDVS